jgi:hypothetical protein
LAPAPINPTRTSFSLIGKQLCSCVWQRETVSLARPALQCHDPHGLGLAPNSFPPLRHRPQPDGTGGGQVPARCTPAGRAVPRCGRARDEISPGEDPRGPLRSPAQQPVRQHPGGYDSGESGRPLSPPRSRGWMANPLGNQANSGGTDPWWPAGVLPGPRSPNDTTPRDLEIPRGRCETSARSEDQNRQLHITVRSPVQEARCNDVDERTHPPPLRSTHFII